MLFVNNWQYVLWYRLMTYYPWGNDCQQKGSLHKVDNVKLKWTCIENIISTGKRKRVYRGEHRICNRTHQDCGRRIASSFVWLDAERDWGRSQGSGVGSVYEGSLTPYRGVWLLSIGGRGHWRILGKYSRLPYPGKPRKTIELTVSWRGPGSSVLWNHSCPGSR